MTPQSNNTHGTVISIVPETNWEQRLLDEVRGLRDACKDAIILYDYRTNTVRVFDGRARASIKLA